MEFPQDKFKPNKDRYAKSRGGPSAFLYITCANCEEPKMVYQKDGKGRLLRCYSDRIAWPPELVDEQSKITTETIREIGSVVCSACENILAIPMVYKPENRPAYRLIPGSTHAYKSPEQAKNRAKE